MNIKKGDKVIVLAGKDKGKTGKVLQVFSKLKRVSVEGVNVAYKNLKPRQQGEKGQRVEFPSPLHISNLALVDPKTNKPTRVGKKVMDNKKKVRVAKKSGEVID